MHREIWLSTLGDLLTKIDHDPLLKIFFKPAYDMKAFSGEISSKDWIGYLLEQFDPSFPISCSKYVEIESEYRVYVVNGEVRTICQYRGPKESHLDIEIVTNAVKTLFKSDEGKSISGCGMDFMVIRKT